jgi:hypothetical protein
MIHALTLQGLNTTSLRLFIKNTYAYIYIHLANKEAIAQDASYQTYAHIDEFLEEAAKSSNLCES